MATTFPGETAAYRQARDALLAREAELRRTAEAVAEARRALPPGGEVPEDYAFTEPGPDGAPVPVRLSGLFAPGKPSLVVYSMMFPRDPGDTRAGHSSGPLADLPLEEGPCPSCTAFLDQLDGVARHAAERINFVVAAKAPAERLAALAADRGWRHHRLVSTAGTTFNRDYHAELPDGRQQPMVNVFHRDGEVVRHFWASELLYAPADAGQDPRHVGTLEALWNLFDLTPEGRAGEFDEQIDYDCCH
jgi:predicted dithiol-disulfide oxidoreductase (DUF899 family)